MLCSQIRYYISHGVNASLWGQISRCWICNHQSDGTSFPILFFSFLPSFLPLLDVGFVTTSQMAHRFLSFSFLSFPSPPRCGIQYAIVEVSHLSLDQNSLFPWFQKLEGQSLTPHSTSLSLRLSPISSDRLNQLLCSASTKQNTQRQYEAKYFLVAPTHIFLFCDQGGRHVQRQNPYDQKRPSILFPTP